MKGSEFLFGTLGGLAICAAIAESRGEVLIGGDPLHFVAVLLFLVLTGMAIDIVRDIADPLK